MKKGFEYDDGIDFDTWHAIACNDPDSFETMRQMAIEQLILGAPVENRERLRRLQWRIDQERHRARSPLGACVRISRMMWNSVLGEAGLRERLADLSHYLQAGQYPPSTTTSRKGARVLAFRRLAEAD